MKKLTMYLLLIVALNICGASPGGAVRWPGIGTPTSQPLTANYLSAVDVAGSRVYAAGTNANQVISIWYLENGNWISKELQNKAVGTVYATFVENDDSIYFGLTSPVAGYVYRYKPSTEELYDMRLTTAKKIYDVTMHNNILYAAGTVMDPVTHNETGQCWRLINGVWESLNVTGLNTVDALTSSQGYLYIAGVNSATNYVKVMVYTSSGWVDTGLPADAATDIWLMINDGNGTIYAGGITNYRAAVWKYNNGAWSSTGPIDGNRIFALTLDNSGVLYAGGVDSQFKGQVWGFLNGTWINTNLTGSSYVNAMVTGPNNTIYAVGMNNQHTAMVWIYKN
ncbi:hypothetical protein [Candidatus Magnetominusculus xianensis]|uniref:Uncharacterized protein n=1 Tax=Candidatus Magnetominusculus xianensis TaxID=1748249 RepID=A0ABR5SG40_9BACT|nr:hypothetical protein [Candidatus Magnetominusculus xianensis]KWT87416.1 hypothetical protein ASN18_1335 [Candidatus Magnetominusculus xianensis]MBF0403675.1 hypothetical protein [Nitrospirota bacterium]